MLINRGCKAVGESKRACILGVLIIRSNFKDNIKRMDLGEAPQPTKNYDFVGFFRKFYKAGAPEGAPPPTLQNPRSARYLLTTLPDDDI